MNYLLAIGIVLAAYLIGSLPIGYVTGRVVNGRDVRDYGSGRTGGTNVLRTFGPAAAVFTLVGDVGKSVVAIELAQALGATPLVVALAALAVVVGHNYPIFLRFHGGAGVAVSVGAMLAIYPPAGLGLLLVAGLLVALTRHVSVGSLAFVNLAPFALLAVVLSGEVPAATLLFAVGAAVLVTWAHRPNIARLIAGNERKLGEKGSLIAGG